MNASPQITVGSHVRLAGSREMLTGSVFYSDPVDGSLSIELDEPRNGFLHFVPREAVVLVGGDLYDPREEYSREEYQS